MAFNSTPQDIVEQNINGLLDIHPSWTRVPLSLISDVKNGFAFKSTLFNKQGEGERLIRIRDVVPGDTKTYYSGAVPDGYWVKPDDIVVGMDGDFNLAWWQSKPALLNQRVCRLDVISQSYIKRFLYRVLPGYIEAVNLNTSSTTVKHLSSKTLNELLIPLPPLAEQQVIAAKLDSLLAQVENTQARLERIPQILKRFRQSVLAAAVSGRLTEDSPSKTWARATLGKIALNIRYGTSKKCSDSNGTIPVLRIPNIGNGFVIQKNLKFADFLDKEKVKLELKTGDLLMIRSNGSLDLVGKTALVRDIDSGLLFAGYLIRVRLDKQIANPAYISLCLRSPEIRAEIEEKAKSTSGVNNINSKELSSLELPLPSVEEQTEIVRRVEQLFAYAEGVEQQVNNALERVNNLTQSILAKAFRGELTAQWREEHPELISAENSAEALLERIKAERAAMKTAKKPRQRARKS